MITMDLQDIGICDHNIYTYCHL